MDTGKRLFCFGCGYSALVLAKRLAARGFAVAGTCRTEEKAARLREEGIETFVFGDDAPLADAGAALRGPRHPLTYAAPGEKGAPCRADDRRLACDCRPVLPYQSREQ